MLRFASFKSVAAIFLLSACITPIDFKVANRGGIVIISASLSTFQEPQKLMISVTTIPNRPPIPISDATAFLFDDQGSRIRYQSLGNGTYTLPEGVNAMPGVSYILEVSLADGGFYRSSVEAVPSIVGADDTSFKIASKSITDAEGSVITSNQVELYSNVTLPSEGLFLYWAVDEAYIIVPTDFPDPFNSIPPSCFVTGNADPQKITLFNGTEIRTTEINSLLLASREIDKSFLTRHTFLIKQNSISFDSYEYFRKVNLLVNQTGSIFDAPPASIVGNIKSINSPYEEVLGYFLVANTTASRIAVTPGDIPFFIQPICTYIPDKPTALYPSECSNCFSVQNSSGTPPIWF